MVLPKDLTMHTTDTLTSPSRAHSLFVIGDGQGAVLPATVPSAHPTGADILAAAGCPATADQIVLQILRVGGLESIRLDERAALSDGDKFVVAAGDRTFRFTVDAKQFEWPHRTISGAMVRELAALPAQHRLALVRGSETTHVEPDDTIDLAAAGLEKFISQPPAPQSWKIKVQGVTLDYDHPMVKVGDAMTRAGFDPKKAWHIYLLVSGEPKQEVSVEYIVDLRTPGIEKIRLMQRNVDNGEGQLPEARRLFKLLAVDHQYLEGLGLQWETVLEGDRRWLLIHDYALPKGFSPQKAMLALDIPKDYPAAQIDMFYFAPFVGRTDGAASRVPKCAP
ncbi:hypothetical protein AU476_18265 [Cupriavidus sp. UYMSc13B]|nr:hypothetical protein AU476_18265 [Cupriavidus sp. UYMSc13B]